MESLHVISPVSLCIVLMIITFEEDNPLIILFLLLMITCVFARKKALSKLKRGFIYFIYFAPIIIIINMLFVSKGSYIVFSIFNRDFTLESIIYAFSSAFKLLITMYIFSMLSLLTDSDAAVSYFLSKFPKTTLAMLIGFKFFPLMKERMRNVKMIYAARGVEFEKGNLRKKIQSNVEILEVLLTDSLEAFFGIAETAYVRGFLSGRRTMYDKYKLHKVDYKLMIIYLSYGVGFILLHLFDADKFDIYSQGINEAAFINISVWIFGIITFFSSVLIASGGRRLKEIEE